VRILTGLPLSDPTSGFKAIRTEVLKKLDWKKVGAEGYGFQIELHHAVWKLNYSIREIPIIFTERRDGYSKMTAGIAWEAAWRVLKLALIN
jgi:dolichol-phosphate mannosyltransferase